ncbi:MAG: hypothetical protein ACYCPF_03520 [Streptosporangiaceae bacterium]
MSTVRSTCRVDANATMWRLRSLAAMGHDATRIARALGTHPVYIHRVIHGHARTIPAEMRDDVTCLWDAWWDKTPPADSPAPAAAGRPRPPSGRGERLAGGGGAG